MDSFITELEKLINKYSIENTSNAPDFILANYLTSCLKTYVETVQARDNWYEKQLV